MTGTFVITSVLFLAVARGMAVFLNADRASTPLAQRAHVEHGHALHRQVIVLSVLTEPRAHVDPSRRIEIDDLGRPGDGIVQVIARFGYNDRPDVPAGGSNERRRARGPPATPDHDRL